MIYRFTVSKSIARSMLNIVGTCLCLVLTLRGSAVRSSKADSLKLTHLAPISMWSR